MKPETEAWRMLADHAAGRLHPDFANRVLRAVRARRAAAELPVASQLAVSATMAALFLLIVVFVHERSIRAENARNLAGWRQVAADAETVSQFP
jgi:hypothetical protein